MAAEQLQRLCNQARQWAARARQAGWLAQAELANIESVEARTPGELFESGTRRPLVVAFFGGTGVGKSSLLNRLAGEPVARTGVERPTSREVTIYLHKTVQIQRLPREFPVEKVKIALHQQEENHDILWIDMPDIDSVDTGNRKLVLEWLPHVDVLIYVVSPERYRDDRGWRLLLEHGQRHAWLFVINQWDRGTESQREDFVRLLGEAGFHEPIVLRTDSREGERVADDFEKLAATIRSLANAHTVEQLERRGISLRIRELGEVLGRALERSGEPESLDLLRERWREIWEKTAVELGQGLAWKTESMAERFATRDGGLLQGLGKRPPDEQPESPSVDTGEIWDAWAQTRLQDALDSLVVEADALAIPAPPLRAALPEIRGSASSWLEQRLQGSLRATLLRPGTALQRFIYRTMGVLSALLPLTALGWVGYRLLTGYYQSAQAPQHYLGMDFAIHSLLLVVTAWLLPWLAHRKLKPSMQKAARRGLQAGIASGLAEIDQQVRQRLEKLQRELQEIRQDALRIMEEVGDAAPEAAPRGDGTLARMLVSDGGQGAENPAG